MPGTTLCPRCGAEVNSQWIVPAQQAIVLYYCVVIGILLIPLSSRVIFALLKLSRISRGAHQQTEQAIGELIFAVGLLVAAVIVSALAIATVEKLRKKKQKK